MSRFTRTLLATCCLAGCASGGDLDEDQPVVVEEESTPTPAPAPAPPPPPAVEGGSIVPAPATPPAPEVAGHQVEYGGAGPRLSCVTAHAVGKGLRPVGARTAFATDSPHVVVVYWAEAPIPAGTIRFELFGRGDDGTWSPIGKGAPQTTDGSQARYVTGLPLNRAWAQAGGAFEFRGYWNDESEPLLVAGFTVTPAKHWALCVAISDYPPAGPNKGDLPMIDDAAERMAHLLQAGFGFSAERTVIVKDAEATSARIQKELLAIAEQAGPNDVVAFYYTGHGCQVPDLDGDEPDGWDEALATADQRPAIVTSAEQLELFLVDDRLAEILARFKTPNVTVIFDSCHSGTAVRAGDAEAIDAEELGLTFQSTTGFGRRLVQAAEDASRTGGGNAAQLDVAGQYVYISAAQAWEVAQGRMTPFKGGVFSVNLRAALENANGECWNEIVAGMLPNVHRWWAGQTPRVHGAGQRLPFSLVETPTDAPFVRPSVAITGANDGQAMAKASGSVGDVAHVAGNQTLFLEQRGVEYDVFDADDVDLRGTPKGRITLSGERVDQSTSAATIVAGVAGQGDRAVPRHVRLPDDEAWVVVSYLGSVPEAEQKSRLPAMRAIFGELSKISGIRVAREKTDRRDYLVLGDVQGGQLEVVVATASGIPVGRLRGANLGQQAADTVLARHRAFARLSRLSNPSPPFRLRLVQANADVRPTAGDALACSVDVSTPAYVWVLSGPDGGPLALTTFTRVPLAPGERLAFAVPTAASGAKRWVVKVLASTKALDPARFRSGGATVEALAGQLAAAHGGSGELIATDGWAETAFRVHLK